MYNNFNIKIMELNCKGLVSKLQEIKKLIYFITPDVICFNETWLRANREPRINGYISEWHHRDANGGGLGIIIVNQLQYIKINLVPYPNGMLEAMAIKIYLRNSANWLYILNLYNPCKPITRQEVMHYVNQLGILFVIMGDMNAHTPILDYIYHGYTNPAGRALESVLSEENLVLINPPNFITYVDYRTGKPSCLDVCIASPAIAAQIELSRAADVGSDHSPILAEIRLQPVRCIQSCPKRWNLTGTNWKKWAKDIPVSNLVKPDSAEALSEDLIKRFNLSADSNIKMSAGKTKIKKCTPWWDAECSRRVAVRRRARAKCERHPTTENIRELRKCTAEAKHHILKCKKESWRSYVNTLEADTPIGEVWRKIKTIKSQYVPLTYPLIVDGQPLTSSKDKASAFGKHFQQLGKLNKITYPENLKNVIQSGMCNTKKDEYNSDFIMSELISAIDQLKNTSPGIDNIPNMFFKNINHVVKIEILNLFNTSWNNGVVPDAWKLGVVIPILKPNKDKDNVISYRPITLLPCIAKLMEKLIHSRLEYWVESNNILAKSQCGFRKRLSTIDALLRLENKIRKSMDSGEHCLVVYLDLKGAFDKVWHEGLMYKLGKLGLEGNLFRWVHHYLKDRKFYVRIGGELSDGFPVMSGVPQGAILSPILFNIMLSDMPSMHEVDAYCYADDLTFSLSHRDVKIGSSVLQRYMNDLVKWLEGWGLVVSQEKTTMQVFSRSRKCHPIIRIKNQAIPIKKEQRLLGLILDAPQLTFGAHIKYLVGDIQKRINIMKVLSSIKWGACKKVLRTFYIAFIRSKMDYASVLFCKAATSNLHKLDKLQNVALRLITGARKTSPILSLEVESYISPLNLRREMLIARQYIKLLYRPVEDETVRVLNITSAGKRGQIMGPSKSFMTNINNVMNTYCSRNWKRIPDRHFEMPPWINIRNNVFVSMECSDAVLNGYLERFNHLIQMKYKVYSHIYTDGSRIDQPDVSVASGVYIQSDATATCWKLDPQHSVLSAELFAIKQALLIIKSKNDNINYAIFTDSQSATLMIRRSPDTYNSILNQIQSLLIDLNRERHVVIQWIKGHANIKGNNVADRVANLGHKNDRSVIFPLHLHEMYNIIRANFLNNWDINWKFNVNISNKGTFLRSIVDKIGDTGRIVINNKMAQVAVTRLRIGHAGVRNHLERFNMASDNLCEHCHQPETIEHFILKCGKHVIARKIMIDSLKKVNVTTINIKVLLGGSDYTLQIKRSILNHLIKYLLTTNRLAEL